MNKNGLIFSLALILSGTGPILHAEGQAGVENGGNAAAGKEKAASCAGCHGENGNSLVPMYPKLAQQHANYIERQLQAFKSQARDNPVMSPMAMALSEADMADLAAYYSEQKIEPNPEPVLPPADEETKTEASEAKAKADMQELINKGSNLYRNGNLKEEVSACIACHGPYGEGNKPAGFPSLHSQHAEYLIKSLSDFKSGARSNNPDNMMHMIAKKMSDEEIKAVAYYISTMK